MATTTTTLPTLLSTKPILLVYTIPLLIISILLTFAGTFLTLDRSYSFSPRHGRTDKYIYPLSPRRSRWKRHKYYEDEDDPRYASFEQEKERGWFWWWRMEAGVGGLAIGYLFGLHLTTFLFLLFPVLSPPAFLSVSIISSVLLALLSTRFKVATFVFSSLSSAFLTSLVLCLVLHPPMLGRYIILGIISPLFTLPTIVTGGLSTYYHPSPAKSSFLIHIFLRITTSTTGAFSFLLAVSLLPDPPLLSWQNAYSRFYISNGEGWGTAQEKGFIAAWFFFAALGYIEDWALKHWLGQNPDETWDEYLDWYVHKVPYDTEEKREGDWKPLPGFWERILGTCNRRKQEERKIGKRNPLLFGDEEELQDSPPVSLLPTRPKNKVDEDGTDDGNDDYTLPPFVTKRRKKNHFAKFRAQLRGQSKAVPKSVGFRPVTGGESDNGSSSSATIVASNGTCSTESVPGSAVEKNGDTSYSDVEVDLTAMAADVGLGKGRPKFLHRHLSNQKLTNTGDNVEMKGGIRPTKIDTPIPTPKHGDRARERVRAFVGASPTRLSRPLSISVSQSHLPMAHQSLTPPLTPPVPGLPASVPATPSLLNAIKRVEVARQQVYAAGIGMGMIHETAPSPSNAKPGSAAVDGLPAGIKDINGWDDFWTEVKSKARSP